MKPRIGVVGAGYWGKNLIRNLYKLGHLYKVCDVDECACKAVEEQYPGVESLNEYEEILADPDLDGIVLSTPAITHYEMARDALRAGKHVFVEKPLALRVEDGEELVELAGRTNRILMVGHILQYHNAVIKLKEMIGSGELGKIQYIYSNRLNIGKIRAEENILWSFAPHDISVILMLLEEMPEFLSATGGNYLQESVSDVTVTTMSFSGGVKAHIFVSWLHPFKEQKLVVIGDEKMVVFDDSTEEKLFLYPHKIKWLSRKPVASKAEAEVVPVTMVEPLLAECQHFIECIETGRRPRTDGYEGLRVLQVLSASQRSMDQRGKAIALRRMFRSRLPLARRGPEKGKEVFIHESAYVDEGARIGEGTSIWHFSHVLPGSRIGQGCRIGQNVMIGPKVSIGDYCKVQNNVSIYQGVTMEDHVFCGPSMVFTNVHDPRCEIPRMDELRPTLVKKGATIGANATIICGNNIGRYAFVGAGAVVTKDVPDFGLIMGNPGRLVGWVCRCAARLCFDDGDIAVCDRCGSRYRLVENGMKVVEVA